MMNIKEIVIGSTAVVSLGLGVMNIITNKKNKKRVTERVTELEKKIINMNSIPPRTYYGFDQPQPTTVPTE